MPTPFENAALYGCGSSGCHQQVMTFPSLGGGDGFEWDPSGVTFGIDFQTDRIFDGSTVTNDYAPVLAGGFNESNVSSNGLAINTGVGATVDFIGGLLAKLAGNDYTCVLYWRQFETFGGDLLKSQDEAESTILSIYIDDTAVYASDNSGDFNELPPPRIFGDNVLAFAMTTGGVLASLNGTASVLSAPAIDRVAVTAGFGSPGGTPNLDVFVKAVIFYPSTDVPATLEAYSANVAPDNTVAPAITGTAQVGQQLSISTGTWTNSPTSYEYQWYADNFSPSSAIGGATSSTFIPTAAQENSTMKCVVYALNADGIGGIAASDDEIVIAA